MREENVLKKLMPSQLSSIQDLADNPLIEMASVDFHSNGLMRVTVVSSLNADWNAVDVALEEIFPGIEYQGQSAHAENDELYFIDYNGETLINLVMKKAPAPTEVPKEINHPKCIINVTKVESLLDPWYLEQIAEERRVRREV